MHTDAWRAPAQPRTTLPAPHDQGYGPDGAMHAAVADLGGSIITGIDGNPLAVLARQLGAPLHPISEEVPLYQPDGSEADRELDSQVRRARAHMCAALGPEARCSGAGVAPEPGSAPWPAGGWPA